MDLRGLDFKDDKPQVIIRRDVSGGINNRQAGYQITENQMTNLVNCDISVRGENKKRPGFSAIEDLGSNAGTGAFGFMPDGGTNELLVTHGTKLEGYTGSGTFTEHDTGFTTSLQTQIIQVWKSGGDGSVAMIQNGTDNAHEMKQDHSVTDLTSDNDDPPKTTVNLFYRGRWWALKDNSLYYSDAYPSNYAGAFDQANNYFKINCGEERFLIGIRDTGIIVGGRSSIWGINPSATPAATDKPEKLVDIGCIAEKSARMVGDDVFYLAPDGVRSLHRTQEDKLQLRTSYPLSYALKDEYDSISWGYIDKASAVYFNGKYFLSLPVDGSTYNNEVWVFYPDLNAWAVITGWEVADWAITEFSGEEKLYFIESNDGKVRQAWTGYDDGGTAIDFIEEGRKEDMGQPLVKKYGGELKVRALASGDYDVTVYASIDDEAYQTLGTLNVQGNAPTLPVDLPFTLAPESITEESFHLDSLGPWKTLRIKFRHNATNGSDDIKIYERQYVTYPEAYESE